MIGFTDSEEKSDRASFQDRVDLDRFRQLIREAEQEHSASYEPPYLKDIVNSGASTVKNNGMSLSSSFLACNSRLCSAICA